MSQTIDLIRRLDALGVHYESMIFPGETHSILRYANEIRMDQATVDFLERYLSKPH